MTHSQLPYVAHLEDLPPYVLSCLQRGHCDAALLPAGQLLLLGLCQAEKATGFRLSAEVFAALCPFFSEVNP